MEKLITIQKREKLNEVFIADEAGPGGGHHTYHIVSSNGDVILNLTEIQFQKGPRNITESTQGVIDSDLLEIVRHRLQCFQAGPYASRENSVALTHIEEALMWMNRRVEDRIERNVLGTYNK